MLHKKNVFICVICIIYDMPREPIIKPLVLEILRKGPASYSEIKRRLEETLGRKLNDGIVVYVLKDLEKCGAIEKTIDGRWVLGGRYPILTLMNAVNEAVKNFEPILIEDYGVLLCDPKSVNKRVFSYWKAWMMWGFKFHFLDAAEQFMGDVYVNYARLLLGSMSPETRSAIVEAILKLAYFGCAIYMGKACEWEKMKEFDEEHLSSFLYIGLGRAADVDDPFLHNLWLHNILGHLVKLALSIAREEPMKVDVGGNEKLYGTLSELYEALPKLYETLKKGLLDELRKLRLMLVIYLDEAMFSKSLSLQHMFEKWLKALKYGALDDREHIFGDDRISLLEDFARLLEKKLTSGLSLEEEKKLEEMMYEKIDWDEPWTLGDLYKYHPRGRTPQFYAEILDEILSRKIKPKVAEKVNDIIPPDKPSRGKSSSPHPGTIRLP